ncbi:MAG: UDP-3-O-(3-hydroxymyristoyl)glucosamine N-acyltransferase [Chitinophagales bacterium]|nr:UDP-3-O-(3-hydroxymyristoyl)glucosamine N-acyltransferase [Chitinophagales bacterium]
MSSFTIKEIFPLLEKYRFLGDENGVLSNAANFEQKGDWRESVMWLSEASIEKNREAIRSDIGLLVLSEKSYETLKEKPQNALLVNHPRETFQQILSAFFEKKWTPSIEKTAVIHTGVNVPTSCYIGHFVVIEEGVVVGENCYIGHHTVIHRNTVIGQNVTIGTHNTIGGVGFGYTKNSSGQYSRFAHLGNVVLESNVTIHNNTCIDRAVMGSTIISEGAKIDNLVHIAHGVVIGKNTLVIANSMIAGSTKIGENCWVAPSVSILNKLNIAEGSTIGMGAVVLKDVPANSVVFGNPARKKDA